MKIRKFEIRPEGALYNLATNNSSIILPLYMKEEKEISKLEARVTQWKRGDEDGRFTMAKISEGRRACTRYGRIKGGKENGEL